MQPVLQAFFQLASSNPRINDDIERTLQRFLAFCGMVVLLLVGIAAAMAVLFFFVVGGTAGASAALDDAWAPLST